MAAVCVNKHSQHPEASFPIVRICACIGPSILSVVSWLGWGRANENTETYFGMPEALDSCLGVHQRLVCQRLAWMENNTGNE